MSVGDTQFPQLYHVSGVMLSTGNAGIKQTERDDVLLIELPEGASCAGVFTRNAFCAAPVHIARSHLENNPRWLLVNSGNANAGTGQQGMDDAMGCCQAVSESVSGNPAKVLPFSTGVIGERLPVEKIQAVIPKICGYLQEDNWAQAANAIMTTDTFAKAASEQIEIAGQILTVTGISKGAGMIQPDMATMLGFVATDAVISQSLLQQCIADAADQSFNRITVDGDTSTNDACMLVASGCSQVPEIKQHSDAYQLFSAAVTRVCKRLAELIVRDGEGATKLITISVEQALDSQEALKVAKTVAHSPLVKTAFFASDPNWGRILAAVGRSEVERLELQHVEIYLNELCIVRKGGKADSYTEELGQEVMDQEEILVRVVLARGEASEQVLTCDLSYDYVKINAEYRT